MDALAAEQQMNERRRYDALLASAEKRRSDGYEPIDRGHAEDILRADGDLHIDVLGHDIEFPMFATTLHMGTKITGVSSIEDEDGVSQTTIAVASIKPETLWARVVNWGFAPRGSLSMYARVTHFQPATREELHKIVDDYQMNREHIWRDCLSLNESRQREIRQQCEIERQWIDLTFTPQSE